MVNLLLSRTCLDNEHTPFCLQLKSPSAGGKMQPKCCMGTPTTCRRALRGLFLVPPVLHLESPLGINMASRLNRRHLKESEKNSEAMVGDDNACITACGVAKLHFWAKFARCPHTLFTPFKAPFWKHCLVAVLPDANSLPSVKYKREVAYLGRLQCPAYKYATRYVEKCQKLVNRYRHTVYFPALQLVT